MHLLLLASCCCSCGWCRTGGTLREFSVMTWLRDHSSLPPPERVAHFGQPCPATTRTWFWASTSGSWWCVRPSRGLRQIPAAPAAGNFCHPPRPLHPARPVCLLRLQHARVKRLASGGRAAPAWHEARDCLFQLRAGAPPRGSCPCPRVLTPSPPCPACARASRLAPSPPSSSALVRGRNPAPWHPFIPFLPAPAQSTNGLWRPARRCGAPLTRAPSPRHRLQ
jgi:hypothetical protein